jgi:3',5'-cyclic-AMP phosphodiesterase
LARRPPNAHRAVIRSCLPEDPMPHHLDRRDVLKLAGLAGAAALLGPGAAHLLARPARPERKRALRIAHLTDIHVQPELRADGGMAACLRHVNTLADKPDLIITGGDHVYDSMAQEQPRTKMLWDLWAKVLKDQNAIPVESCLGNHDVWGWSKSKSKASGDEALYGKKWAAETLRLGERPYRTLDRAGWHLVFLDSIFPKGEGYTARLDDEQLEWLAGDLAALKPGTPTLIISHIPIMSVAVVYFGGKDERTKNEIDPSLMHTDSGRLHKLFLKHQDPADAGAGGVGAAAGAHICATAPSAATGGKAATSSATRATPS